jgi:hypothetical protein
LQQVGKGAVALQTWHWHCQTSAFDPGCAKTSFKSEFAPNLIDFRKLQFVKSLISLMLKI